MRYRGIQFLLPNFLRGRLDSVVDDWIQHIEKNIGRRKLFRRGESILIAVSGGLDSMALLHSLHELSQAHGWKINVAHFNHQLRGRSSDADEKLVKKIAAKLHCNFVSERGNVKKFAKANGISIEMAARTLRHEFLARAAKRLKIQTVALAHHADDQVELFFLRLLRGAGTEGLAGMSWKSKSPADSSIQLVRPLLNQSKARLRTYAETRKIRFREDASNVSLDFQRNRIRLEVLPSLKKIQPAVNETVLRAMEISAAESNFVSETATKWLGKKKRIAFELLHIAVQRVCLRLQLRTLGVAENFELIEQLRLQPDRVIAVDAAHSVSRDKLGRLQKRQQTSASFKPEEVIVDLEKQNEIDFGLRKLFWSFQNKGGASFSREKNCETFDVAKVGLRIHLRHWKPGDRFQPIGAKAPKKLQDLFTDLKIPRVERHDRIIATTEQGKIFWVEGLRISECFKLDTASRRRLKWHWQCFADAVAGNT